MLKHCVQTTRRYRRRNDNNFNDDENTITCNSPYETGTDNEGFAVTGITDDQSSASNRPIEAMKNQRLSEDTTTTMAQTDSISSRSNVLSIEGYVGSRSKLTLNSIAEEQTDIASTDTVCNKKESSPQGNTCKLVVYASIIVAAVVCTSCGIGHYYVGYYPESEFLNQGDMKLTEYSTWFCSEVFTENLDVNTRLVVLSKADRIGSQFDYRKTEQLSMRPGDIWTRRFYLLKNSRINIIIETNDVIDILGFDSEKKLDVWKNRKESQSYIMKASCCAKSRVEQFDLIASSEGMYLVTIYRSDNLASSAKLNITLKFHRTTFDFSKTEKTCETKAGSCSVSLKYASSQVTVIEVPNVQNAKGIPFATKVTWKCNARIWFYIIVFGCIYILIVIIIVGVYILVQREIIHKCYDKCRNKSEKPSLYTVEYNNSNRSASLFSVLSADWRTRGKGPDSQINDHVTENGKLQAPAPVKDDSSVTSGDGSCSCRKASIYSEDSVLSDRKLMERENQKNGAKRLIRGKDPVPTGIAAIYRDQNTTLQTARERPRNYSDAVDSGISMNYNIVVKPRNEESSSVQAVSEDECRQIQTEDVSSVPANPEVLLDWSRDDEIPRIHKDVSPLPSFSISSIAESENTNSELAFNSQRNEIILEWPSQETERLTKLPDYYGQNQSFEPLYMNDTDQDKSRGTETTILDFLHVPNHDERLLSWSGDSLYSDMSSLNGEKRTKSTGYFRVYSPMSQERTGAVAGRRELRSANPIFYRPASPLSFIDVETSSTTGITC